MNRFVQAVGSSWSQGKRARADLPDYPALERVIRQSPIPRPPSRTIAPSRDRVASSLPPLQPCDVASSSTPEGKAFCVAAQTLRERPGEESVRDVVAAVRDLKTACADGEPSCGEHVPATLIWASAVLRDAGKAGKAVAVLRFVQNHFPRHSADVALRLADAYHSIGIFDLAARHGVEAARLMGWNAPEALRRALLSELALGKQPDRLEWLHQVLWTTTIPIEARREWAELAFTAMPGERRARWREALPADVRPETEGDDESVRTLPTCDPTLWCGYVAVLNDPTWSPASAR